MLSLENLLFKNDFVYLDVVIDNEKLGRLVIEVGFHFFQRFSANKYLNLDILFKLFKNLVPKTCENFRLLCTGEKGRSEKTSVKLHYKNSIIHRIVPHGWIQGGGTFPS